MSPCDYKKDYPENWHTEIRPAILKRANNCCEECGLANGATGERDRCGVFHAALDGPLRIVLTVAHLNHDTTDNDGLDGMPAITLWQPWASFVAWHIKTIETRRHDRLKHLAGKRIAIHAGKTWDPIFTPDVLARFTSDHATVPPIPAEEYHRGAVLAIARVARAGWLTGSDTEEAQALCKTNGLHGLFLEDTRAIHPQPARGAQGVWTWHREHPPSIHYSNLRALCQRCHLRHDKPLHSHTRNANRDERAGQLALEIDA